MTIFKWTTFMIQIGEIIAPKDKKKSLGLLELYLFTGPTPFLLLTNSFKALRGSTSYKLCYIINLSDTVTLGGVYNAG